jgi:molecular chaperone DnaK (HSP70)
MADASMQKTVDSGSGTTDISLVASANGITPLSNGFSLGADTDLNVATEIVYYECAQ